MSKRLNKRILRKCNLSKTAPNQFLDNFYEDICVLHDNGVIKHMKLNKDNSITQNNFSKERVEEQKLPIDQETRDFVITALAKKIEEEKERDSKLFDMYKTIQS